ncbi:radical SAM family heme chaperone HemW [candidate division KSB1 bacterium]|nr:radical SAM family heme chaperone HemW [candidate division KSB1 bacterium]
MSAGLYVHVPFCAKKCLYCNFYSVIGTAPQIQDYATALQQEIDLFSNRAVWKTQQFSTIYFGGGTPSLLPPHQISSILVKLTNSFSFASSPEITLEANPESTSRQHLKLYRGMGFNRINIGIQSFFPHSLELLGRIHNVQQATSSIRHARLSGFDNIGIDLIFGIPGQTFTEWETCLETALAFEPEHISTYSLTLEKGTALTHLIESGTYRNVDEESERRQYLHAIDFLSAHGYEHYEISNFARTGFRSVHNQLYWNRAPYLGLGPSAHSFYPNIRYSNFSDLVTWHTQVRKGRRPVEMMERLSPDQQMLEWIFLGLRKREGFRVSDFNDRFKVNFEQKYRAVLKKLNDRHRRDDAEPFLVFDNGWLKLSRRGLLLYDSICAEFA